MAKEKVKKEEKKVDSKKVKVSKKKDNKPKEKLIPGIKKELKLVKWPSFKELVKYTIATIVFCLILVGFFELLKVLMALIKGLFN